MQDIDQKALILRSRPWRMSVCRRFFLFFHALFDYRAWLRGYIFVTELPLASTHTPTCCSECGRASRR